MHVSKDKTGLYGLMAEFDSAQGIVDASTKAVAAGYSKLEAYTPFPIEELNDIIHKKRTILPKLVLFMAFAGMMTGFTLQYWASVIEYPLNIGGRPLATWPAFVIPSYELTILFSALTAAIGMIALNGLPQPYHPVFNVDRFSLLILHDEHGAVVREAARGNYPTADIGTMLGDIERGYLGRTP